MVNDDSLVLWYSDFYCRINWIISIIKKDMDKVALWFLVLSFGNVIIQLSELIK